MLFEFAELNTKNRGNLYHTLYKQIKEACECGAIRKGEKLPSIREAAEQLGISRTTIENAYTKLCIEGIVESFPQRGYFATGVKSKQETKTSETTENTDKIKYDFSSRRIDRESADTEIWKKLVRSVLCDSEELTSYGDPQGELSLRQVLASYSYKARGVRTETDNIVIGAGIGPLLNIICGLVGRDVTVGFESAGFRKAEAVFSDYGIKFVYLETDSNGATLESIVKNNIDILFLMPSTYSKISITSLVKRRNEFVQWAKQKPDRLIIEDDYNGELRYTARAVPAFQGKASDNTIYIGSFSKLLLPSVRIAYMALPQILMERFVKRRNSFNQTCGKIEQLALKEYIISGALEKHLRRLRRLYYNKSQILYNELKRHLPNCEIELYESSLMLEVKTDYDISSQEIYRQALKKSINIIESSSMGAFKLCFAGISENEIEIAAQKIGELFGS